LLRLIPTASHTVEDINFTIEAFVSIKDKLAMGVYQRDAIIIPN